MRFYFDSDDLRPKPEPPKAKQGGLDREQRAEFIERLRQGSGRAMVCMEFGIDLGELERVMARSPRFRRAVESVEQLRAENLFTGLYAAALNGDTRAARFLLGRRGPAPRRRAT